MVKCGVKGEAFYSPWIMSQSFSDLSPADCELHKCFSAQSPVKKDRMSRVAALEHFPPGLGFDKIPAGEVREDLVKCSSIVQNGCFSSSPAGSIS